MIHTCEVRKETGCGVILMICTFHMEPEGNLEVTATNFVGKGGKVISVVSRDQPSRESIVLEPDEDPYETEGRA